MAQKRLLLDVNVWVALFDDQHIHNAPAIALMRTPSIKIASCAITEIGAMRVMGILTKTRNNPAPFHDVSFKLQRTSERYDHEFWLDDLSLRDPKVLNFDRISGHNQITDAYLLALAVKHNGALATLDHRVAISSVYGAKPEHLILI